MIGEPLFEFPGPKVGLIGDIHGHLDVLARQISDLAAAGAGIIVQVGDLGAHWDGSKAERRRIERLDEALVLAGCLLLCTPGNHENFDLIDQIEVGEGGIQWVTPRFGYLPRGWRGVYGTRVVAGFGGGNSVDYMHRRAGIDWWERESITEADLERLGNEHVGVLLTHDAPLSKALARHLDEQGPSGFSETGLEYGREGGRMLHRGMAAVQPRLIVSGHFHVALDTEEDFDDLQGGTFRSRSVILEMQGAPGSAMLLDLETLRLKLVEAGAERPVKERSREFRALRRQAGLTTAEAAQLLNISDSAVNSIESSHLAVGEHVLDKLRDGAGE